MRCGATPRHHLSRKSRPRRELNVAPRPSRRPPTFLPAYHFGVYFRVSCTLRGSPKWLLPPVSLYDGIT